MKKNSGNILSIILVVVGIVAVSVGGYFWWANQNETRNRPLVIQPPNSSEGQFCGGFAGIICPENYYCEYEDNYPDAGGKCVKNPTKNNPYECPKNGWLNCMPMLSEEGKRQCANIDWFKTNCPNFQGVAQ